MSSENIEQDYTTQDVFESNREKRELSLKAFSKIKF